MLLAKHERLPWMLAGATLLAHLAVANRYDFFRDELYFIICGRHPSFGYVDQPPVVPLLSAASQLFGEHLWVLRAIPAFAAAAVVRVTCALASLVGTGRFGVALAGIAAGTAPMYLGLDTTLNTGSFEPLLWTMITFFVARAVVAEEPGAWIPAGFAAGIDLEIKYELPLYLVPLLVALVLTGHARALLRREVARGIAIAAAIAAPSAIWQAVHGFPFLELMHNQAGGKNTQLGPIAFILNQVKVMNPLFAPLWLSGAVAPFIVPRLREWRFISLAFTLTFALMLVLHAKDYYLAPAYGVVFAVGAVAIEGWVRSRRARTSYVAACVVVSALLAPLAMPILDPSVLAEYLRAIHLAPTPTEKLEQSAIPQHFADMLGWRELEQSVAAVYRSLPPNDRRRAAIFSHNYGEAAALDFYGAADGLPPALSPHNAYFTWGTHGFGGSVIIRTNGTLLDLARRCESVTEAARFGVPLAMPYENDAPIFVCRGLHQSLDELWPSMKFYY